jgi:Flp pilus assembly protein TadG
MFALGPSFPSFRYFAIKILHVSHRRGGELASSSKASWCSNLLSRRKGSMALEFAVVGPVLLMILLGIFVFGLTLKDYLVLTSAASQGAQTLAMSRGTTTPYNTAVTAINNAAPSLNITNISISMTVGAASCSANSCKIPTAGQTALVTLQYPCNLVVFGVNYGGTSCNLTAQSANVVQ